MDEIKMNYLFMHLLARPSWCVRADKRVERRLNGTQPALLPRAVNVIRTKRNQNEQECWMELLKPEL